MNIKKWAKAHLIYFLVILCFVLLITALKIGCPFFKIFGIPCPTCGITRSLVCILKGDIVGYARHHVLGIPLLIAVWLIIHNKLFYKQKSVRLLAFSVLLLNVIYYFYRLVYLYFA